MNSALYIESIHTMYLYIIHFKCFWIFCIKIFFFAGDEPSTRTILYTISTVPSAQAHYKWYPFDIKI